MKVNLKFMGIFYHKPKEEPIIIYTKPPEPIIITKPTLQKRETHETTKEIIQHYEYVKQQKNITYIDKIVDIIRTIDWDNTEPTYYNHYPEYLNPSAPPFPNY
jgi:hypothetical protein